MNGPFSRRPPDDEGPRWRELEGEAESDGTPEPPEPPAIPERGADAPWGGDESTPPEDPESWVDDPPHPPGTLIDDRPRPPAIGDDDGVPRIRLTRWNPYKKLTPENRQFVRDLMRFPSVTVGIVAVLSLIYLWMLAAGWEFTWFMPSRWGYPLAVAFGALEPERVRAGEWWRLVTAALLHGSLLHLAVNSFMLYQLGRLAENVFGRAGLVVLLVGSAIAGTAASAFIGQHMSVGASGAVMGLVGACIAFGLRHRGSIPEFLRGLFGPTLYVYAGIILLIGLVPGIDGWGHFGGAVGGVALGLVLPSPILREGKLPGWIYAPFALAVLVAVAAVGTALPRALAFDGEVAREAMVALEEAVLEERWDDAAAALDEAARLEPDSPFVPALRQLLAGLAMASDRWALASEQLAAVEAVEPEAIHGDPGWLNDWAWAIFMAYPEDVERCARGVELSRASLEDDPEQAIFLNTLAWGLYLTGDYHGALGTIEEAMRANRGEGLESDIYVYVASLYAVGRRDEAVDTYREAVAQHPEGVLHEEVKVLINRWEDAGGFDAALAAPPSSDPAMAAAGEAQEAPPTDRVDPPPAGTEAVVGGPSPPPDDIPPAPGDDDSAGWTPPGASWN